MKNVLSWYSTNSATLLSLLAHFTSYLFVWLILTRGELKSLLLGIPAICLAIWCGRQLISREKHYLNPLGMLSFTPYFLYQSLKGGIDVMRRALSPELPLFPGMLLFKTFLPAGAPRVFFANVITLLPGTLSVDVEDDVIIVHTIDTKAPVWSGLLQLEAHVASLYQHELGNEKR